MPCWREGGGMDGGRGQTRGVGETSGRGGGGSTQLNGWQDGPKTRRGRKKRAPVLFQRNPGLENGVWLMEYFTAAKYTPRKPLNMKYIHRCVDSETSPRRVLGDNSVSTAALRYARSQRENACRTERNHRLRRYCMVNGREAGESLILMYALCLTGLLCDDKCHVEGLTCTKVLWQRPSCLHGWRGGGGEECAVSKRCSHPSQHDLRRKEPKQQTVTLLIYVFRSFFLYFFYPLNDAVVFVSECAKKRGKS